MSEVVLRGAILSFEEGRLASVLDLPGLPLGLPCESQEADCGRGLPPEEARCDCGVFVRLPDRCDEPAPARGDAPAPGDRPRRSPFLSGFFLVAG